MKKLFLFILLAYTFNGLLAQTQPAKRVNIFIKELPAAKTDSARLKLLDTIRRIYVEAGQFAMAKPYAFQSLQITEKLGNKIEIARKLNSVGNIYANLNDVQNARNYWLRCISILDEIADTTYMRSDVLENTGLSYLADYNYPKAKELYEKALAVSLQRKDKFHEAMSRQQLGRTFEKLSDPVKAKEYYSTALKLFSETGRLHNVAVVKTLLCDFYTTQGDFRSAFDYGFQSLKLSEFLRDNGLIATNLNDLAIILIKTREYDSALSYLFTARAKFEKNKVVLPYILGNIGVAYAGKKDYDNAIKYAQQSLDLSTELNLTDNNITRLNNLAEIYITGQKYTEALEVLFKSLKLAEGVKDNELTANTLTYLGKCYLQISKDGNSGTRPDSLARLSAPVLASRAAAYLQKAINICRKTNNLLLLQENYRLLAEAQHAAQNDIAAFSNFSQYILYRDSVYNIDKAREQNKLILQYQFDKQVAEKDKELALSKAAARFRVRLAAIIGAAILLFSGLFFYFRRKAERNKYQLEITSLKQQALNAQMSDHFISNTMDSINQFIRNNDKEKASEYLVRFHRLIRKVLENAPEKMIPLADDLDVLYDYIELEKLRFLNNSLDYTIDIDERIDTSKTLIPPMILQIMVENALKHGFSKNEGGRLLVRLEKKEHTINCLVEDNGRGRSVSFPVQDDAKHKSLGGTLAEKLIRAAAGSHKTYFKIIDLLSPANKPAGTAVQFSLPYILSE